MEYDSVTRRIHYTLLEAESSGERDLVLDDRLAPILLKNAKDGAADCATRLQEVYAGLGQSTNRDGVQIEALRIRSQTLEALAIQLADIVPDIELRLMTSR